VHNTDDADGHAAAEKIRTLLKFVKHPAYRLELLTSKVTGRFFCPVNGSVRLGQTPLHFAVSLGKWEAVAALLEDACCLLDECYTETGEKSGEHVKLKDLKTQGSLSQEQEKANKTIDLAYLDQLKRQYSVLWTKDSQGNSVFHLAVIHNRKDMYLKLHKFSEKLSKLLESHYFGEGKRIKKKTKDEWEYEFYVGSKFNSFEAYDDEFLKNDNGYTPLELAAYLGNVSMIRFLLNTFETNVKWSFADRSVALKKVR
jgi:ankyrin repeat protein